MIFLPTESGLFFERSRYVAGRWAPRVISLNWNTCTRSTWYFLSASICVRGFSVVLSFIHFFSRFVLVSVCCACLGICMRNTQWKYNSWMPSDRSKSPLKTIIYVIMEINDACKWRWFHNSRIIIDSRPFQHTAALDVVSYWVGFVAVSNQFACISLSELLIILNPLAVI